MESTIQHYNIDTSNDNDNSSIARRVLNLYMLVSGGGIRVCDVTEV